MLQPCQDSHSSLGMGNSICLAQGHKHAAVGSKPGPLESEFNAIPLGLELIKLFSCSTHLRLIVGILTIISRINFSLR